MREKKASPMADGSDAATVKFLSRIAEINAAEWDSCAGADNPFVSHAFLDALEESMARIKADPAAAAAIWVKAENSKLPVADAEKIIKNPQNEWTTTPKNILTYLDYMNRAGLVSTKTNDWKDIFFSGIHGVPGS